MANKYAGTQTEKNLQTAFAGESQARNKYTYFASVAKKEGYEQIAAIFLETADNEKEHAKLWFKELEGIGDTAANLKAAAEGENYEWTTMYKEFAETAEKEGFKEHSKKTLVLPFGNAEIVVISLLEKKHQNFAHAVLIHKASSKLTQQIINLKNNFSNLVALKGDLFKCTKYLLIYQNLCKSPLFCF